ncbi:BtpA/SgcQ family protein [Sulfolobus sp. S-194]|uniref:BtpA/SgcQ family protein n=1 Tax=Sulfolobus sp. S-194 TaxID=2512240 RepID=UPI001436F13F|nr:BtpA/SgcQ family protein [Sulfolobus sp. S-194]QIW24944.1 BtpA/SgcQ family protein [Sulfolobus sp. S-194]
MKLIGVVHLLPLPGSFFYKGEFEEIIDFAINESKKLEVGGFDAVILENFNDKPFRKKVRIETAIAMGIIAREVKKSTNLLVGINLLRNSAYEAASIASLTGDFIRVNALCETISSPEGIIEPASVEVQEALYYIKRKISILADINVKHASPLHQMNLESLLLDCKERGFADYIIVTGERTGKEPNPEIVKMIKNKSPLPVCVGSGITPNNIKDYKVDCFIIGTYLKDTDGKIKVEKVKEIANAVKSIHNG